MKIKCQRIRGLPGHGLQEVRYVTKRLVSLGCGCYVPISWLSTKERKNLETTLIRRVVRDKDIIFITRRTFWQRVIN